MSTGGFSLGPTTGNTKQCDKCKQFRDESLIRNYHFALKNNTNQNSFLKGVTSINLCLSCDSARKTTVPAFLEQG